MTQDTISVRRWQELYRASTFASDDEDVRNLAGWSDFYEPLTDRRVQSLVKLAMGITHPFILDSYSVYFVEHRPGEGPRFGSVCFFPITGRWDKSFFSVELDSPFNRGKWGLHTGRYGEGAPEYECGHIRRMLRYIHTMAHEVEHDIKPAFIAEKEAVEQFLFESNRLVRGSVRREGEHGYSFWDERSNSRKTLLVVRSLSDIPPETQTIRSREIDGLYVYCLEDAGILLSDPLQQPRKPARKGVER